MTGLSGSSVLLQLVISLLSALAAAQPTNPCTDTTISKFPFCNANLDIKSRVEDLVGRMQTSEKISQLGNTAPAVDRLNIPAYQWWSEALHGIAHSPGVHFGGNITNSTSFPQVVGLGATFNTSLYEAIGSVIATEARAMHNAGQAGLTFFTPDLNIYRDPRWGRCQEVPGEDPYLTSRYGVHLVHGLQQGEDQRYLKIAANCKAFAVYNLENWNGTDRHYFNAIVPDQDLVETYFPAFEACVREGNVASIMCSYNAVNGVPSCANDLIQNKIVRDQWGFQGFFVSDCGAINTIMSTHKYTSTPEDTVAVALKAGTDLNCGSFYQKNAQAAYDKKTITDDDLNLAMRRLFTSRIGLGMFDPPENQPYCSISTDQINTPDHQALALQAARESIVLLQNDGALPLDMSKKVALIGPNANATATMQGNYNGNAPFLISPLEGLQKIGAKVTYAQGCDVGCTSDSGFADAVNAAKAADAVVVIIGLDLSQEREGHDRTDIGLPGKQDQLLQAIKGAIAKTTPMIVVLMSGGSVDITTAKTNANGVLWVGYPGQSGGQAIAEVLYGKYNPSGRLPFTIYPDNFVGKISFLNMSLRTPPGRTYKFYTGTPVYAFGTGLSYTQFTYKWSMLPQGVLGDESLTLTVEQLKLRDINYEAEVSNTGKMGGSTSVLAYITSDVKGAPMKQLFDFQKVYLDPGQSVKLFFAASPDIFKLVDEKGEKQLYAGNYEIHIGDLKHAVVLA